MKDLLQSIDDRSLKVVVVGLGYVGLPVAVAFAEAGFHVTGLDVDSDKVARILSRESYIGDIASSKLAAAVESGRLTASADSAAWSNVMTSWSVALPAGTSGVTALFALAASIASRSVTTPSEATTSPNEVTR